VIVAKSLAGVDPKQSEEADASKLSLALPCPSNGKVRFWFAKISESKLGPRIGCEYH
jgi:hypothetical protein